MRSWTSNTARANFPGGAGRGGEVHHGSLPVTVGGVVVVVVVGTLAFSLGRVQIYVTASNCNSYLREQTGGIKN